MAVLPSADSAGAQTREMADAVVVAGAAAQSGSADRSRERSGRRRGPGRGDGDGTQCDREGGGGGDTAMPGPRGAQEDAVDAHDARVLWRKSAHPDNHVPSDFLAALKQRQVRSRP